MNRLQFELREFLFQETKNALFSYVYSIQNSNSLILLLIKKMSVPYFCALGNTIYLGPKAQCQRSISRSRRKND